MHKDGKINWRRNHGPSARPGVGWKWHGSIILRVGAKHATPKNVLFGDIKKC